MNKQLMFMAVLNIINRLLSVNRFATASFVFGFILWWNFGILASIGLLVVGFVILAVGFVLGAGAVMLKNKSEDSEDIEVDHIELITHGITNFNAAKTGITFK